MESASGESGSMDRSRGSRGVRSRNRVVWNWSRGAWSGSWGVWSQSRGCRGVWSHNRVVSSRVGAREVGVGEYGVGVGVEVEVGVGVGRVVE